MCVSWPKTFAKMVPISDTDFALLCRVLHTLTMGKQSPNKALNAERQGRILLRKFNRKKQQENGKVHKHIGVGQTAGR